MSGSKRYVLDANVFIEAKNKYYGFYLCPGFWKALIGQHESRHIFSIDKVRDEPVKVRGDPGDGAGLHIQRDRMATFEDGRLFVDGRYDGAALIQAAIFWVERF